MIPILVLSASASSIEWVVSITAHFSRFWLSFEITPHMNLLASGSIPAEGSSSSIIGGLPIIAIATYSLRLLPPESELACLSRCSSRFISFKMWLIIDCLKLEMIPLSRAKNCKCSSTESSSKMTFSYGQKPINFLALSNCLLTSKPPILTYPPVGLTSLVRHLNVVVFPAPLTPSNAKHSPYCSPKDACFTATVLLNICV